MTHSLQNSFGRNFWRKLLEQQKDDEIRFIQNEVKSISKYYFCIMLF